MGVQTKKKPHSMRYDVMVTYVAPFHALGVRFPVPPYNHFAPKKMIFEFGKAELDA